MAVYVVQDNNKRALATEQDRAQLEMQIQTFKQSRGLFLSAVIVPYSLITSVHERVGLLAYQQGI